MDIERLKELRGEVSNVAFIALSKLVDKNARANVVKFGEDLQELIDEAIARQSVKNEEVHLCNDCEYGCMAACPITKNVKFGNGQGNDNVIECENYINKEALKKWRINQIILRGGHW